MTHHETLLARKAEIETWFSARDRAPAVHLSDPMDVCRALEDLRVDDAEAEVQRRRLAAIETALTFEHAGWTGRCATCDKPISAARLAAVPEAVLCCRCQEAEDGTILVGKCRNCNNPAAPGFTQCPSCRKSNARNQEGRTECFTMAKYRVGK